MSQQIEALQTCSMMLYYYYLSYKRFPLNLDPQILNQFTFTMIQQFKWKFPTFSLEDPQYPITSFILFEDPFSELCHIEDRESLFSDMFQSIIAFPSKHYLTIRDDYCILSILPIPFDSLDITHGMIVNYFTPKLDCIVR